MFTGGFSHAPELIIILVIALIIFGPKKLPSLGKGIGEGIREFRKATSGESDKDETASAGGDAVTAASAAAPPPVVEAPKSAADITTDKAAAPPAPASTVSSAPASGAPAAEHKS
jgi:TatA/E family protein of Tat protein translocase